MLRRTLLALAAFAAFAAPAALAQTPAQDAVAFAAISPDGANLAMIRVAGDKKVLIIAPTVGDAKPKAVDISDRDVRSLSWVSNGHVVTSFATPNPEARETNQPKELRAAFSLNVATMKSVQLLGARNAALGRSTRLDRIIATVSPSEVLMLAPVRDEDVRFEGIREAQRTTTANEVTIIRPALSVWRVNLDTGIGEPIVRGEPQTFAWIVAPDAKPLARADFTRGGPVEIWSYVSGAAKRIYSGAADARVNPQGRLGAGASALVTFGEAENQTSARALDLATGALGPELLPTGVRVVGVGRDRTGAANALYVRPGNAIWLEPKLAKLHDSVSALSPGATIQLRDATDDHSKAILKVIRDGAARWFLYDVASSKADLLGPDAPRGKDD
jgi:hypothetical protein